MAAAEPWIAAKLQVARSKKVSRGLQRSGGILDHALPELLGAGLQPQVSSGCRRAEKMGGSLTSSMERRQVRARPRQRRMVWGPGTLLGQGKSREVHATAVILMAAERSPKKKLTRKLAAVGFGKVVICIQGRDASRGLCLVF